VGCSVKTRIFNQNHAILRRWPAVAFRLAEDNSICTSESAVVKLARAYCSGWMHVIGRLEVKLAASFKRFSIGLVWMLGHYQLARYFLWQTYDATDWGPYETV